MTRGWVGACSVVVWSDGRSVACDDDGAVVRIDGSLACDDGERAVTARSSRGGES